MALHSLYDVDITDPQKDQELQFKVDSIGHLSSSLLDARDTFFDFSDFVEFINKLWDDRQACVVAFRKTSDQEVKNHCMSRAIQCEDQLNAAFDYFETAYRQRLLGAYSELFTSTRADLTYPGSITDIIKAADYVCKRTLEKLRKDWPGFVVFSVTQKPKTVSSVIVIYRHSYFRKADFIQDWLISGHEIGHIYFWKLSELLSKGPTAAYRHELMISEIASDAFCQEQSYMRDSESFLEDLIFSHSHSLPIRFRTREEARYFVLRVLASWMYAEIQRGGDIRNLVDRLLKEISRQRAEDYEVRKKMILNFLRKAVKIRTVSVLSKKVLNDYLVEFIKTDFLRHDQLQERAEDFSYLLWTINEICRVSFLKKSRHLDLRVPAKPAYDERSNIDAAKHVARGKVVEKVIEDPYVFLKTLRDICYREKKDLDEYKNSNVRVAAILSLSNSYTLTQSARRKGS